MAGLCYCFILFLEIAVARLPFGPLAYERLPPGSVWVDLQPNGWKGENAVVPMSTRVRRQGLCPFSKDTIARRIVGGTG
jgi:hypothetical protein